MRMASLRHRILLMAVAVALMMAEPAAGGEFVIDSPLLSSKVGAVAMIKVDQEGKGNFTTVQAAVDAVPDGNSQWVVIHVKKGVYRTPLFLIRFHLYLGCGAPLSISSFDKIKESRQPALVLTIGEVRWLCGAEIKSGKVKIPKTKPFIFLRGNGKGKTFIVWDDVASKENSSDSATFTVHASNFIAWGISFKNDAPVGVHGASCNQSVAALVGGDKSAFYHCAFYSSHNTLSDYKGRHYYESCYIQGSIDFIYGRAQSIYKSCEVFVIPDKREEILGSITAQNRHSPTANGGFVFDKGRVYGVGSVYLGRTRSDYSRVVFAKTYLSKTVKPEGWSNWRFSGNESNLLYAEYDCHGPGATRDERVQWSKELTAEEAEAYMSIDFIAGNSWLPVY